MPFWVFPSKGGFTICDTQELCVLCLKHYFYSVFSKHSFAEIKECKLKRKHKFTKNRGLFAKMQKGVFFLFVFLFFCVFCFLCVFVRFCLEKSHPKLFSCSFRVFVLLRVPKGLSLQSFFSSYSVLFPCFPVVLPFKVPFFLWLLSINPFLENICFCSFCLYFFVAFAFVHVCLVFFKQAFLTSPFETQFFHFVCFDFSSVVLVFVFMFYVSAFLFLCWLWFWYVFILFLFCFLFDN